MKTLSTEALIRGIFRDVPFDEAIKQLADRVDMKAERFYQLADEAKARAFTVTGIAKVDALEDVRTSLQRVLEEGGTLKNWKDEIGAVLDAWNIGGWHAETIYRTNLQTAYQAGRYQQMTDPDVLLGRPFWRYVAVIDDHTRPDHRKMHGRVFAADDPIWNEWYPPNGFNCRCTVVSLSADDVKRRRLDVETFADAKDLAPDEGWNVNVGKAWSEVGL